MKYRYVVDLGNLDRFSETRRASCQSQSRGVVNLRVSPHIGETLQVDYLGKLKITDIQHENGQNPLIVLDGTVLNGDLPHKRERG